jgi:hypothetical protein
MDRYFEWKANRAAEDALEEKTSRNGERAGSSATVPGRMEDLAEHRLHNLRALICGLPGRVLTFSVGEKSHSMTDQKL